MTTRFRTAITPGADNNSPNLLRSIRIGHPGLSGIFLQWRQYHNEEGCRTSRHDRYALFHEIYRYLCLAPSVILLVILATGWARTLHAQWLPTNGPLGGPARTLASNDTFLFAEMHGGVFRSGDSGNSWTRLKIGLPSVNVTILVASGGDVYAATWGNGIMRSTDNGEHWISDTSILKNRAIDCLLLYGSDLIAATTTKGVFRSASRGAGWREMNNGLTSSDQISRIAASGRFLIGCSNGGRLFRYSDSAGSWSRIDSLWLIGRSTPAVAATGSVVVIGWEKGLIRSTDHGATWNHITTGLTGTGINHPFALDGRIYNATSYGGFYLLDTGTTSWIPIGSGMNNRLVCTMAIHGDMLFAGTVDGIYRSNDNGIRWKSVNQGMVAAHVTALAVSGNTVVAGTHAGGVHRSTDNGGHWSSPGTGLPHRAPVTALLLHDSTIFAGTMDDGMYRSTDNGGSWHGINNGLTDSTITALAVSYTYLFAATREGGGIFRSDDNGANWTELDIGVASPGITALAVNGSTIVAGSDGEGVFRSTDNGEHWKIVGTDQRIINVYSITTNGASMVLAERWGIYYSDNNGANWTRTEPNVGAYSVAVGVADNSSVFYAGGMKHRLLRSSDGGRTWKPLKERVDANQVAVSSTNLYVGTSGWGVLRQPLSEISIEHPLRMVADTAAGNPNPVLGNERVTYRLNRPGLVSLTIYDVLGHIIARPVAEMMQTVGEHSVKLPTKELGEGSYRCTIMIDGMENSVRFAIVR